MIQRISNKLKRIKTEVSFNYFPSSFVKNHITENQIYMYHGIDSIGSTRYNSRHTSIKCFEKQLIFFKKNCNLISSEQFFHKEFDSKKPSIAITIDDGFFNNYKYALPIIEKLEIPVTIFVTGLNNTDTKFVWADFLNIALKEIKLKDFRINDVLFSKNGNHFYDESGISIYEHVKRYNSDYKFKKEMYELLKTKGNFLTKDNEDYWRLLSDQQIIELSKSKWITIGSHGFYHNNLGNIPFDDAKYELNQSKNYLENLIQKEVNSIGYPDGSYSREVIDYADSIGLKYQFATESFLFEEDFNDSRILQRKGIYSCDSCGNQLI